MAVESLGFPQGAVVQEFLYDTDTDLGVRDAVEAATGAGMVGEDHGDMADGALIWWRADDAEAEDLADLLMDASGNLEDGGLVWVLTPKSGHPGHVPPADISDAADIAGLHATSAMAVGPEWAGMRLVARPRGR